MKQSRAKGFVSAMVSSCSYGLIPLFSLPVMHAGMFTQSVLIYRFGLGTLFILLGMLAMKVSPRITWSQFWRIGVLAFFSMLGAVTLLYGYNYMPSGPATTIQFSYPVFTCVMMVLFFHERLTLKVVVAIVLAVIGVMMLSGVSLTDFRGVSVVGVGLELIAGLTYAIYLVLVPVFKVNEVDSLSLTFWVFVISVFYLVLWALFTTGIQPITTVDMGVNLLLLAFIPTAVSNLTLILGLRHIGSTLTSILGALEPLTAMVVGVLVFAEPFTLAVSIGFLCIVASVTLLIYK
ncbi:MAG: DMT family transporter [Sodaliphilus sp.]